jgi:fructose-1,6-bisphosphatase/inositol monophosphatase family enzyme
MDLPISQSGATARAVAERCAERASDVIREGFGRTTLAGVKGRGNVVTETDFAAERATMEILQAEFPDHAILSEESASETRSEGWMWVVDPLDGTKNFSRGIPHFGFNLALCWQSVPVLGVTAHPLIDQTYVAERGRGCTVNGTPVNVSECASIEDAVVAIDMGYDAGRGRYQLGLADRLWPGMQSLRITGSAALGCAFVAAGNWDIYVHSDLQPWDIAPGLILVREAGGRVVDRYGNDATLFSREAVAANAQIVSDFELKSMDLAWA